MFSKDAGLDIDGVWIDMNEAASVRPLFYHAVHRHSHETYRASSALTHAPILKPKPLLKAFPHPVLSLLLPTAPKSP